MGKPLEISTDLAHIRSAAEAVGALPIGGYIPEKLLDVIGKRHRLWVNTVRENIRFVEPDDDINYSILGMLLLDGFDLRFDGTNDRLYFKSIKITCTRNTHRPRRFFFEPKSALASPSSSWLKRPFPLKTASLRLIRSGTCDVASIAFHSFVT